MQSLNVSCWTVFAGNIRVRDADDHDIAALLEEASMAADLLQISMEAHLEPRNQSSKVHKLIRHAIERVTHLLQENSSSEENVEYLLYRILHLIYQLSFRIRKRARRKCFREYLKVVR